MSRLAAPIVPNLGFTNLSVACVAYIRLPFPTLIARSRSCTLHCLNLMARGCGSCHPIRIAVATDLCRYGGRPRDASESTHFIGANEPSSLSVRPGKEGPFMDSNFHFQLPLPRSSELDTARQKGRNLIDRLPYDELLAAISVLSRYASPNPVPSLVLHVEHGRRDHAQSEDPYIRRLNRRNGHEEASRAV